MEENEKYYRAKKRVKAIREFYNHLAIYASVMTLLFIIDVSDGGNWWFYWPAMGWGIFVVMNGVSIRARNIFGHEWEERKIQQFMEQEQGDR